MAYSKGCGYPSEGSPVVIPGGDMGMILFPDTPSGDLSDGRQDSNAALHGLS